MRLVPAELPLLEAALESDAVLAAALGVEVAPGWNGFPGALPPRARLRDRARPARGRALATAAVHAMLDVAWAAPEVRSVTAHTLAERSASVRVLEKAGFEREAEIEDPDDGPVWRFRLRR